MSENLNHHPALSDRSVRQVVKEMQLFQDADPSQGEYEDHLPYDALGDLSIDMFLKVHNRKSS